MNTELQKQLDFLSKQSVIARLSASAVYFKLKSETDTEKIMAEMLSNAILEMHAKLTETEMDKLCQVGLS